jgi:hypothetical protein
MATVLRSFDWSKVSRNSDSPRSRSYPWHDWFDGRIWQLEPETDFDGPPHSLEKVIRSTATKQGIRVRIRITPEGNVVMQRHDEQARVTGVTKSPSKKSLTEGVNVNGTKPATRRKLVRSA